MNANAYLSQSPLARRVTEVLFGGNVLVARFWDTADESGLRRWNELRRHAELLMRLVPTIDQGIRPVPFVIVPKLVDIAAFPGSPIERVSVAHQMCRLVEVLHALGLDHRDVKPSNFLAVMGPNGEVWLLMGDVEGPPSAGYNADPEPVDLVMSQRRDVGMLAVSVVQVLSKTALPRVAFNPTTFTSMKNVLVTDLSDLAARAALEALVDPLLAPLCAAHGPPLERNTAGDLAAALEPILAAFGQVPREAPPAWLATCLPQILLRHDEQRRAMVNVRAGADAWERVPQELRHLAASAPPGAAALLGQAAASLGGASDDIPLRTRHGAPQHHLDAQLREWAEDAVAMDPPAASFLMMGDQVYTYINGGSTLICTEGVEGLPEPVIRVPLIDLNRGGTAAPGTDL